MTPINEPIINVYSESQRSVFLDQALEGMKILADDIEAAQHDLRFPLHVRLACGVALFVLLHSAMSGREENQQ